MIEKKLSFIFGLIIISAWKSQAEDITVKCDFKEIDSPFSSWELTSLYKCDVSNPNDFIGDEVKIVEAEGEHLIDKSNEYVTSLSLNNALNLTKMPSNIENVFGNIIYLSISSSRISEISASDLEPLKNLRNLWITRSNIKVIRSDLFNNHPNMRFLMLALNLIEHVDRDAFNNMNELTYLYLNSNPCESLGNAVSKPNVLKMVEKIQNGTCESEKYFRTNEDLNGTEIDDSDDNSKAYELTTETEQIAILEEGIQRISNNYEILNKKYLQSNKKCQVKIDNYEARIESYIQQISLLSSIIKTLEDQLKLQRQPL